MLPLVKRCAQKLFAALSGAGILSCSAGRGETRGPGPAGGGPAGVGGAAAGRDGLGAGGWGGCCGAAGSCVGLIARIWPLSDMTRSMIACGAVSVGSSARLRRRRELREDPSPLSPYSASSSATVRWVGCSAPLSRLIDSTVPRTGRCVQISDWHVRSLPPQHRSHHPFRLGSIHLSY